MSSRDMTGFFVSLCYNLVTRVHFI
jgi:hypothetical protein